MNTDLTGANRGNGEGLTRIARIFANYGPAQPVCVHWRNLRQGFYVLLRLVSDTAALRADFADMLRLTECGFGGHLQRSRSSFANPEPFGFKFGVLKHSNPLRLGQPRSGG
jgi:hypothetical protein